ncbi:MAG: hypothetical protein K9N51_02440 [Candidatus Pacebacteria bacterium]|nr:hypothetical protein [Candidatus Paceibacterota bacterium]
MKKSTYDKRSKRSSGDDQGREEIMSIADIGQVLADSIVRRDQAFDRFWNYRPIPRLMEPDSFFTSPKKTCVIFGSNKSTKSTAAVFKAIAIFVGIVPPSLQGIWPHEKELREIAPGGIHHRPRRVRIIVQDYTKHFPETIEPLLLSSDQGMLPEAWANYDPKEHIFHGPDGSFLSIIAVNPREQIDPNILRGPLMDHTLVDELNHESIYGECLARGVSIKSGPRTVDWVYCPQDGKECWTFEKFYLSGYDQNTQRRLPPQKRHPAICAIKVSMRDNPSISPEQIEAITSSLRPWEVAFRVDGEYSNKSSNNFFNMDILDGWERDKYIEDAGKPYRLTGVNVNEDSGRFEGQLKLATGDIDELREAIWRVWALPKDGHKYVIAADVSEGNANSDAHCASVWDCSDYNRIEQVAQLRIRQLKPADFALQCAMMGKEYGGTRPYSYALLVVERNSTGGGMFIERVRNYGNLYKRVTGDKQQEKQTDTIGWYTDYVSKPAILSDLYRAIEDAGEVEGYCPVHSKFTLHELMGFRENVKKDRDGGTRVTWSGHKGGNDDCVMEMAIAYRVMLREYEKITACIIKDDKGTIAFPDEHKLGNVRTGGTAFTNMRPQKSLSDLRRNIHTRSRPCRATNTRD